MLDLPKPCLLTKPYQYQRVYGKGIRKRGEGFSLIFCSNDQGYDRLGISVGGKKLAVRRNRIKRLLKEFYRHNRAFPSFVAGTSKASSGIDLVIATNRHFAPQGLRDVEAAFCPFLDPHVEK